jgi:hypothetical protein
LADAQRRLAQAEKSKLNPEGQAAECLTVAKVAATKMAKGHTTTNPSANQAVAIYNRAAADLAADLPALLRQQRNAAAFTLRDPQTGEVSRLQLESGKPGEYPAGFFQQILAADRIDKRGLTDDVIRGGAGGAVVGVRQSSPPGVAPPRLEPLKGFRVPVTAVVDFTGSGGASSGRLRLLDPTKVDEITLDQKRYARHHFVPSVSETQARCGRFASPDWVPSALRRRRRPLDGTSPS